MENPNPGAGAAPRGKLSLFVRGTPRESWHRGMGTRGEAAEMGFYLPREAAQLPQPRGFEAPTPAGTSCSSLPTHRSSFCPKPSPSIRHSQHPSHSFSSSFSQIWLEFSLQILLKFFPNLPEAREGSAPSAPAAAHLECQGKSLQGKSLQSSRIISNRLFPPSPSSSQWFFFPNS